MPPKRAKPERRPLVLVVRPAPRDHRRGILAFGSLRFQTALGRSGITSAKREGDGATPRASMPVLSGYRRGERPLFLPSPLALKRIRADMLWCDDPRHPAYNRPVSAPFAAGHEKLKRADRLYDVCIVLDWNISERRRGCGSAIFFHIARAGYPPTEGCVAIAARDMARLLPHLRRGTRLTVL
ncbi:L,D-transpeptidase family protein [Rhizobium halophytocola]|uniref:L,D-peptidoglycan transpeptidase YkuD (ErfK/YbiS/YcfS/YnhG family) n=1 Tax=Rhizobium halophytocola TaxID=735519 RepID=A0ABS4E1X8_9HYPH|nr:L,D-transpeptidase family protein [Rhizobium halophytocola]MBP1851926.1 L,D-peptidoglycan transpeptidase YkuD (ErfK/YbiS/YcfS/YnhG family) [Rhizobium halophytocola]